MPGQDPLSSLALAQDAVCNQEARKGRHSYLKSIKGTQAEYASS